MSWPQYVFRKEKVFPDYQIFTEWKSRHEYQYEEYLAEQEFWKDKRLRQKTHRYNPFLEALKTFNKVFEMALDEGDSDQIEFVRETIRKVIVKKIGKCEDKSLISDAMRKVDSEGWKLRDALIGPEGCLVVYNSRRV